MLSRRLLSLPLSRLLSSGPPKPDSLLGPLRPVAPSDARPARPSSENLLSPENLRGLSETDISRMRAVHAFLEEHVDAATSSLPPPDPRLNPLIDQRAFPSTDTLPRVPDAALAQFRADVPSPAHATVVDTRQAWEAPPPGVPDDLTPILGAPGAIAAWAAVDESTMDPTYLARMRRQAMLPVAPARAVSASAPPRRDAKPVCRISDARGRAKVDFREVAIVKEFLNDHGKILPKRKSGLRAKAQRKVSRAVKTARQMALIHPEPKPGLTVAEMQSIERELNRAG